MMMDAVDDAVTSMPPMGGGDSDSNNNRNNSNNTPHHSSLPGFSSSTSEAARRWAGQLAQSAAMTVHELTARKYTLPDKNVASQLLMYRQLLHTKCRPGLKLSRDYQATPAQVAVKHMPWWSEGCEETKMMVISYDNLIRRLWIHGAIIPYSHQQQNQQQNDHIDDMDTLLTEDGMPPIPHDFWVHRLGFQQTDPVTDFRSGGVLSLAMLVFMTESSPHVLNRFIRPHGDASILPFGITSINITDMISKSLMLAKSVDRMDALLSQKPFWRMFADPNALLACQELSMDLLADVVVELHTERSVRDGEKEKGNDENRAQNEEKTNEQENTRISTSSNSTSTSSNQKQTEQKSPSFKVTVFDFSYILEKTERRVQYDLLGAGPRTVEELRSIHARLKQKYKTQLQQRCQSIRKQRKQPDSTTTATAATNVDAAATTTTTTTEETNTADSSSNAAAAAATNVRDQMFHQASGFAANASSFAGTFASKLASGVKSTAPAVSSRMPAVSMSMPSSMASVQNPFSLAAASIRQRTATTTSSSTTTTTATTTASESTNTSQQQQTSTVVEKDDDDEDLLGIGDWVGVQGNKASADMDGGGAAVVRQFSIGDDDEFDDHL